MTIAIRVDAQRRERFRAVVRVRGVDGGWENVTGSWSRSKAKAQKDERDLLGRRDRGALAAARGRTVEAYLSEWLAGVSRVSSHGKPLAPTTAARYAGTIAKVAPAIGGLRLVDLRPGHLEKLRDELLEHLAPQSVADVLRILSQAFAKAEAKGLIGRNPAAASLVQRPSGAGRDFPIITPEFGRSILTSCRGADPWDVAAHLALGMSLRREEVLGLRWVDVDLDQKTVEIERTLTYAAGELHWGPPKSAAGRRHLVAPDFVNDALRRHRKAQSERRMLLGPAWLSDPAAGDLVVDRGMGEAWLPATFSTYWARFAKARGFGEVPFHGLRHGAATLLLAAGVPDPVVISIMGHADTRILRRYQDVVPELMRDASTRLGAMLGEEGPR